MNQPTNFHPSLIATISRRHFFHPSYLSLSYAFCSLEQPNQPRTHFKTTSQSLQSHFVQVPRLLHLACQIPALDLCIRSVTGEILCTDGVGTIPIFFVDRTLSFNVIGLTLTPGVVTDRPVSPNDFLMSSAYRGSASQVMPTAVNSTILSNTRMLCIHSRESRSLLRVPIHGAVSEEESRCTVMLYLAAVMTGQREFPIHSSVSATIHPPGQTSIFALVSTGLLRKLDEHIFPSRAVEVCPAHVNQHRNHTLSPCNGLSQLIGEIVNCFTSQKKRCRASSGGTAVKNDLSA